MGFSGSQITGTSDSQAASYKSITATAGENIAAGDFVGMSSSGQLLKMAVGQKMLEMGGAVNLWGDGLAYKAVCQIATDKVVVVWGTTSTLRAIVFDLSGTDIVAGAPISIMVAGQAGLYDVQIIKTDDNAFLVMAATLNGSDYKTTLRYCTVSGTTITAGTVSGNTLTSDIRNTTCAIAYLSSTKFLFLYTAGYAKVGIIDTGARTITYGTPSSQLSTTTWLYLNAVNIDTSTNSVMAVYRNDGGSSYGTAVIAQANISDNTVAWGTPQVFNSADTVTGRYSNKNLCKLDTLKGMFVYYNGLMYVQTMVVFTVSGTVITFGADKTLESNSTYMFQVHPTGTSNEAYLWLDAAGDRFDNNYMVAKVTVSGTTATVGKKQEIFGYDMSTAYNIACWLASNKIFVLTGLNSYAQALVYDPRIIAYSGVAPAAITSGASGAVIVAGTYEAATDIFAGGSMYFLSPAGFIRQEQRMFKILNANYGYQLCVRAISNRMIQMVLTDNANATLTSFNSYQQGLDT